MEIPEQLFTAKVKKATRQIHSLSDALVNAKFALSLRDTAVWGRGLFVFYNVFAYLEDARERLNMPEMNSLFAHKVMLRKKDFEADLKHYLGEDWSSTPKSEALVRYLEHLQDLERDNPELLLAYVYHLYLGLLSGGQILAKKRKMFGDKKEELYTDKVTDFSDSDISKLKTDFREAMNQIAAKWTEAQKEAFIDESNAVFLLNNSIVNSIEGQNKVLYNMFFKASAVVLIFVGVILAYKMHNK